jgi:hypothetical protein
MKPNDSQIDILMRRHAKHARSDSAAGEHLDADALNAFAEGALPAAARSRYVSHLADCDSCRKIASELSIHAGAGAMQTPVIESVPTEPFWRKLSSFFAFPAFRYAAVATVLIAIVGITFVVWRRSNTASPQLVAQNQSEPTPISAVKPETTAASQNQGQENGQADQSRLAKALPQPTGIGNSQEKLSPTSEAPAAPPKPEAERAMTEPKAALADRSVATARVEATPSFAPPPPGETKNEIRSREQKNVGGVAPGGPRRNESSEKYKVLDRSRSTDVAKEEDRLRTVNEDKKDENKARQPSQAGTFGVAASSPRDLRMEPSKSENTVSSNSEIAPAIRSVGGRKFQRKGSAWVDIKFKSSMATRNIARGSEEFAALDSRLRSIAQQLAGEVVVVWKGKAYRIK